MSLLKPAYSVQVNEAYCLVWLDRHRCPWAPARDHRKSRSKVPGDVGPSNRHGVTLEVDSVIAKAWTHALVAALRDMEAEMPKSTPPRPPTHRAREE